MGSAYICVKSKSVQLSCKPAVSLLRRAALSSEEALSPVQDCCALVTSLPVTNVCFDLVVQHYLVLFQVPSVHLPGIRTLETQAVYEVSSCVCARVGACVRACVYIPVMLADW